MRRSRCERDCPKIGQRREAGASTFLAVPVGDEPVVDIEGFVEDGFCILRSGVPRELAERILGEVEGWGVPDGASGWVLHQRTYYQMPALAETITDRVSSALDALAGANAWHVAGNWGFPTRLPGEVWSQWHIDGDWFTHHIWSGDQVLTPIFLWGDVGPDDGPTLLARRSHRAVARLLAAHEPEGVPGDQIAAMVHEHITVGEIATATGSAGDLYLCHPFLAHAINPVGPRAPRYISNVAVHGFNRVRSDGNTLSPVEQAVRDALK